MFEEMISQEEAEDFVSFCKLEVIRVLGFMPKTLKVELK